MDGGHSLIKMTRELLPNVNIQRCARHLLDDMAKNREPQASRDLYIKLVMLPTGFKNEAHKIWSQIKDTSVLK